MNHLKPTLIEAWEKLKHISKHKVYLNYDIITGWGLRKPKAWVHPYPWHNGQNYQQNITEINKSFFNFILKKKKKMGWFELRHINHPPTQIWYNKQGHLLCLALRKENEIWKDER